MLDGFSKKWSDADLEAMGFNKVVIGVPGRPLPIMAPNPSGTSAEDAYRLEVLEDDTHPIILWSKRTYPEVIGLLYRFLPTPSMLPLFYETLQLLQVENERRIQFYIGKHGSGKSFLGRLIGEMLHSEGTIAMNCADRDINELLFETVLDVAANPDLYTQINERLATGNMNRTSIAALKAVVGSAYKEVEGVPHIDFEEIGGVRLEKRVDEEGLTETEAVFSDANTRDVVETILKIAQVEGLSKEASFMPIKSQLGLLPRIWQEGRVAHLEEYNKGKEGTDTALHPVLQVFNGESTHCRVYGSGGMSFLFDNRERQPGFFCYMDGNMQQDGVATHSLSASANDRILPNIIQDMIQADWQHRWCQMLTGLPIKIFYESKREQWDADPDSFTRFLHMIRGLGAKNVPASHRHYIDRWEDVLDATDIISRYNKLYDEMTNPDSPANREGKYPELFTEVDDEFYNMAGGSMRRNIYYFKMAILGRPATRQTHLSQGYDMSNDWSAPPNITVSKANYHPEAKLGTNIVEIFYRDMVRLTLGVGKVNLYTRLKAQFESLRMMRPELSEGSSSLDVPYLEDLLNSEHSGPNKNLQVQEVFCAHLRKAFSGTPMSKKDDDLLTLDQVEKAFNAAVALGLPASDDDRLDYIFAQQMVPLVTVDNMVAPMALLDSLTTSQGQHVNMRSEDLLHHDHFLTGLAIPRLGRQSLARLWNQGLIALLDSPLAQNDPALQISCGVSPSQIGLTTVATRVDAGEAIVHLLRHSEKNLTLVVGETVDATLAALMKDNDIEYIDRNTANARARIQTFLNRLLIQAPPETESYLVTAFFHRNILPGMELPRDIEQLDRLRLAEILAAPDVISVRPMNATHLTDHKKITAYLAQQVVEKELQA
ncbi:MAG TPA: hypothetical protein ENJ82_13480 [Bacteroidetes bacterium]|nr:hypothetical protein [Bacteroidota bacterium]